MRGGSISLVRGSRASFVATASRKLSAAQVTAAANARGGDDPEPGDGCRRLAGD